VAAPTTRYARPRGPEPAVSYVVRPGGAGGPALVQTLASLSFEVLDHDEVLVLAPADQLPPEVRALAENLGMVRFSPGPHPDAWVDEVRHDTLCYLEGGDRLVEGATQAALSALALDPRLMAVVGEVLGRDPAGRLCGAYYIPPPPRGPEGNRPAPACAVFWRRAHLREHRRLLGSPSWPAEVLAQAGSQTRVLCRTVASVATPGPQPGKGSAVRALARRLPRWLRQPLRKIYLRWRGGFAGG
jgi:hypothetical protein